LHLIVSSLVELLKRLAASLWQLHSPLNSVLLAFILTQMLTWFGRVEVISQPELLNSGLLIELRA